MLRPLLLAALIVFSAVSVSAQGPQPLAEVTAKIKALSGERDKLNDKMREILGAERIFRDRKEALVPEMKKLSDDQSLLDKERMKVMRKCQIPEGPVAAVRKATKVCEYYNGPYNERAARFEEKRKNLFDRIEVIDKAEADRKVAQGKQQRLIDDITAEIAATQDGIADPKQKECVKACDLTPEDGAAKCAAGCAK